MKIRIEYLNREDAKKILNNIYKTFTDTVYKGNNSISGAWGQALYSRADNIINIIVGFEYVEQMKDAIMLGHGGVEYNIIIDVQEVIQERERLKNGKSNIY